MSDQSSSEFSLALARRIDELCDQFEAAWLGGKNPQRDDYLQQIEVDQRPALLQELSKLEQELRIKACQPLAGARPTPRGQIMLTVVGGPNQGKNFTFDCHDTFIVGRGRDAHLQLPPKDRFFSRNHFLLEVNPPRCRLTNLSTTNGTRVNGKKVGSADLSNGDLILAGDTAIRIRIEMAQPAAEVPTTSIRMDEITKDIQITNLMKGCAVELNSVAALGPYHLLRELGRGGMGVVFLGRHRETGKLYAIKTLPVQSAASEEEMRRFVREATILQRLRHPRIVSHIAGGSHQDRIYFAMEYVEGSDAGQILAREGPLEVNRAVRWIGQLLDALEFAHRAGFVHRDIKPSNLLISDKGSGEQLKLADFGLARVYQSATFSGLTIEGNIGGSLPFLPPEQITNFRHVDPLSDIYSAAATLYTLLTGKLIYDFPPRTADRILTILQNEPVPLCSRRSDIPESLASVVHRALARRPQDRFPTAAALRDALLPLAGS